MEKRGKLHVRLRIIVLTAFMAMLSNENNLFLNASGVIKKEDGT